MAQSVELDVVADEDAVAVEDVEGEHVVAGDDDVAARHHQEDGQQAGDRQVVARPRDGRPSPTRPPAAWAFMYSATR